MELVQDLLLTASFALILSFLVAKLLAMAVNGRESEAEFVNSGTSGEGVVMEEVRFEERLKVEEAFRGQRRVQFAGEVKSVDQVGEKPVHRVEEDEQSPQHRQEGRELPEKSSDGEKKVSRVQFAGEVKSVHQFGEKPINRVEEVEEPPQHRREGGELKEGVLEESVAVQLPEKSSDGEAKEPVEKEIDFDRQRGHEAQRSSESRGDEEIGAESAAEEVVDSQFQDVRAESAANDVVASQTEEARVVDCSEGKGKAQELNEAKFDNYSDDDWEGIEKSELDDEFAAAVKADGR